MQEALEQLYNTVTTCCCSWILVLFIVT